MNIIGANLAFLIQCISAIEQIVLDHGLHDPNAEQRRQDQRGHARDDLRREDGPVGELVVDGLRGSVEFDGHPEQVPNQPHAHAVELAVRHPKHVKSRAEQQAQTGIRRRQEHRSGERIESRQKSIEVHGHQREDVPPVQLERQTQRRVLRGPISDVAHRGPALVIRRGLHLVHRTALNLENARQRDAAEDAAREGEEDVSVVVGVDGEEGGGAYGGIVHGDGGPGGASEGSIVADEGRALEGFVEGGGVDEESLEDEDGDPEEVDVGRRSEEGLILHPKKFIAEHALLPRLEQHHAGHHHARQ
mmetsp:Transcript_4784/g.8604  ORF Transcript_4784/g.8604 Transcript_4784/m.8604 type:complete len:304 (-) Transcript_4784:94-1005(-)